MATGGFGAPSQGHGFLMLRTRTPSSDRLLAIYLRHHVAASQGGLDMFKRSARGQLDPDARGELRRLADEVAEDRQHLLDVLRRLGVPRPVVGEWFMGAVEKVGRLKPNGTLVRRSPLSDVMELEALSTAVEAKRLGWVTLRVLADREPRLDRTELDVLAGRAADQQGRLERLRREAVADVLAPAGSAR